jgi:uncharacterized protein
MAVHRATPCIGICSTTYGDLVCRGCKRYAHEIVDWNAFTDDQRNRVWQRLQRLRDACTAQWIEIADSDVLARRVAALRVPVWASSSSLGHAYALLWHERPEWSALIDAGVRPVSRASRLAVTDVRRSIDAEYLERSKAEYERSFRIPADT